LDHSKDLLANKIIFSCLFPLTYALHIAEEYWGGEGYPAYLLQVHGVHFSAARFWVWQSVGIVLMIAGVFLAHRLNFPHLLLIILATVFFKNALTHIVRSALRTTYEPGLVTSILLWVPLGATTLIQLRGLMRVRRYLLGIAIGLGVSAMIELITSGLF
jgi:hypothetical protein